MTMTYVVTVFLLFRLLRFWLFLAFLPLSCQTLLSVFWISKLRVAMTMTYVVTVFLFGRFFRLNFFLRHRFTKFLFRFNYFLLF